MVSLTIVGCLVPYNDHELLNGSGSTDANASPFVIAVKNAGISVVPSIMNVNTSLLSFIFRTLALITSLRLLSLLQC
jgi:amino acid transporter